MVKRDANQPLKEVKPVIVKWLAHEFELLHNGNLQILQKLEKLEEGQFTLYDTIQQSHKICKLKEMQRATPGDTAEPDSALNRLRVTTQSMDREDEVLETHLKDYYNKGEKAFLLPLPWMEGNQFHIENIYTPMKMVEMYTGHDTSLERLFVESETDPKNIRRILIEGEPGIGKSAICKKIAYDWSMNKTPQLFPTFEIVLSLKCRDFHTGNDLWDAIEMQTFSDELKEKRDEIFTYIKSNQNKVLLILDGYNEIPDKSTERMKQSIQRLIHGQLLPHCHIIVTSRPEKSSEMRNNFDRKLEIKGFELENTFTFIRHFFDSAPENIDPIISFINNSEKARDLVRSPLHTAILCLQKQNNEKLSILNFGKEIVFSITKRYCFEKLEEEVNDDEIQSVMPGKLYNLGKMAFILTKAGRGNKCEEEELKNIVNSTGLVTLLVVLSGIWLWIRKLFCKESLGEKVDAIKLMSEFLVSKKTVNTIRTTSCYIFTYAALQEHLAADYVKQSFSKNYYSEWKNILAFKDRATFLRVISFIFFVIKRCIEDKSLKWQDIVSHSLLLLLLFIRQVAHWTIII